jgi:hypothetical protein
MIATLTLHSEITCPTCGHRKREKMPTDVCVYFYECEGCGALLRPKAGDCCVFCSYGSVVPMGRSRARRCSKAGRKANMGPTVVHPLHPLPTNRDVRALSKNGQTLLFTRIRRSGRNLAAEYTELESKAHDAKMAQNANWLATSNRRSICRASRVSPDFLPQS